MHLQLIHFVVQVSALLLMYLSTIPWCEDTLICLCVHQLMDIWVVSSYQKPNKAIINGHLQVLM